MIAESTIQPGTFWIRKIKGNTLYLRIRWDIRQEEREDMDREAYQMWVYEEQEILYEVPTALNVHIEQGMEYYWDLSDGIAMRRLPSNVQSRIDGYLAEHEVELLDVASDI